jgi:hypothetical protein
VRAAERFARVVGEWRPRLSPPPPGQLWRDATGAVLGVRGWKLHASQRGPVLRAITSQVQWPRGVTVARCRLEPSVCERPAGRRCVCGLYAFKSTDEAGELARDGLPVIGLLRAWGRVAVHREGWRAEFAQPLWLAVARCPPTQVRALADRYECDVISVATTAKALAATAARARPVPDTPEPEPEFEPQLEPAT